MLSNLNSALRGGWTDEMSAFPLVVELEEDDMELEKATDVFSVLDRPDCPGRWDSFFAAFPWCFHSSSVESLVLLSAAWCLVLLASNILLSGLLALFFDVKAATESWFLLSIFVFFGLDKLNGMGRVHGFVFLAFP